MKVFHDGLPVWKKGGNLVVSETNAIRAMVSADEAYVLLDLRDPAAAAAGHLPGAVSVPRAGLAEAVRSFPADKGAPVILYDDGQASPEAFATVRSAGYKNASVLRGGFAAWQAEGGRLVTGEAPTEVVYVKRLKPEQLGIAEFDEIVAQRPADKLILDVRGPGMAGVLPGAKVVPQDQVAAILAELPKDREIIVHCNTGILARMAQQTLAANGFRSRYLDAVVQVAADGSYEVTEK